MYYIGIDISKSTFIAAYPQEKGYKTREFKNTPKGIKDFIKTLYPDENHCIMEATGNYCMLLLYMLNESGIRASLINPLKTHNFARAEMSVTKTDAEDAKMLSKYGTEKRPDVYKMPTKTILLLKQQRSVLRQYKKQLSALKNLLGSIEILPIVNSLAVKSLKDSIKSLEKQISRLEEDMINITKNEFKRQLELLTSIKGIGNEIATALITTTGGFTYFQTAKQFSRYIGLCPTIIQSGSSINIKGHINRNGDPYLRSLLYVVSMQAIRCNTACKECYLRLKSKGKFGKVAIIAVANKLIRQAFAVIKSNHVYVDGYVSSLLKI